MMQHLWTAYSAGVLLYGYWHTLVHDPVPASHIADLANSLHESRVHQHAAFEGIPATAYGPAASSDEQPPPPAIIVDNLSNNPLLADITRSPAATGGNASPPRAGPHGERRRQTQ